MYAFLMTILFIACLGGSSCTREEQKEIGEVPKKAISSAEGVSKKLDQRTQELQKQLQEEQQQKGKGP